VGLKGSAIAKREVEGLVLNDVIVDVTTLDEIAEGANP